MPRHQALPRQIFGNRDAAPVLRTRQMQLKRSADPEQPDQYRYEGQISSDAAVDMGGWREILLHTPEAVDTSTCKSLLLNHSRLHIIGGVRVGTPDGKTLRASVRISEKAVTAAGVPVRELADAGELVGYSIGYGYSEKDIAIDEESRTVVVHRWRLLELSLTPTEADQSAGIGRDADTAAPTFEDILTARNARTPDKESNMGFDAWLKARGLDAATLTTEQRAALQKDYDAEMARAAAPGKPAAPAAPAAPAGPSVAELQERAQLAESLGLRASDYLTLDGEAARSAMLRDAAKQRADQQQQRGLPAHAPATITVDERDKIRDQGIDGIIAGRSMHDVARIFARRTQVEDSDLWGRSEISQYLLRNFALPTKETLRAAQNIKNGRRDVTTVTFPLVAALAGLKLIQNGYASYVPIWNKIARAQVTYDYKAVTVAGADMGIFAEQANEGDALVPGSEGEGGGTSALKMRGKIITITEQAIDNDELGQIMSQLVDQGRVGARTEDAIVQQALAAATFSGAATEALAFSEANLKAAWARHAALTTPAGEKLAIPARTLFVPVPLYLAAAEATTVAQGEATARVLAAGGNAISPLAGHYLTDTNDWYLLCDPADAACLHLLQHGDYPVPLAEQIDAAGVPGKSYIVKFPRKAFVTNTAAGQPVGACKFTQA